MTLIGSPLEEAEHGPIPIRREEKRMKRILMIGITMAFIIAGGIGWARMNVPVMMSGSGTSAPSGGPDVWYYPAAKGEGDFGTEAGGLFPSYHFGNTIAVGSAGTATKLAAKVDANTETSVCRICLHEADYTLLAGCNVTMDGTTNPYWAECDINQAVSASTTYVVVISCASSSVGLMKDTGSNGIGSNVDYSAGTCPDGGEYGVDAGNSYGVRIYVD